MVHGAEVYFLLQPIAVTQELPIITVSRTPRSLAHWQEHLLKAEQKINPLVAAG